MKIFESIKMRALVWVWKHTHNCADMSRLASRSLEQPLSWRIRIKMQLHYLICVWCKRYSKQIKFLHMAAPKFADHAGTLPGPVLSAEAKQRIAQLLKSVENNKS